MIRSVIVLSALLSTIAIAKAKTPSRGATPVGSSSPAMSKDLRSLVERMQTFYQQTDDFTADFNQVYAYKAFNRTQHASGRVIFKKPAKMRWDYQSPSPKTLVLSGDNAYAYEPDAKTLTKTSFSSSDLSTSLTFLWGRGKLTDEFSIKEEPCKTCKGQLLLLTPLKAETRFKEIRLEVDPTSAQVLKSIVTDTDGSENAISFSNLRRNTGKMDKDFAINPPDGTEIVDLTKKSK